MSTIDKINLLIKERGITGAELTRAIGIKSTGTYSQWKQKSPSASHRAGGKATKDRVQLSELIIPHLRQNKNPRIQRAAYYHGGSNWCLGLAP